jgi:hypothetical protein
MSTETASERIAKAVYAHESGLSEQAVQAAPTT